MTTATVPHPAEAALRNLPLTRPIPPRGVRTQVAREMIRANPQMTYRQLSRRWDPGNGDVVNQTTFYRLRMKIVAQNKLSPPREPGPQASGSLTIPRRRPGRPPGIRLVTREPAARPRPGTGPSVDRLERRLDECLYDVDGRTEPRWAEFREAVRAARRLLFS